MDVSKIRKAHENLQPLPRRMKKVCVLRSTNDKVISHFPLIYLHPNCLFSKDYISGLRGCCALKFLHTLEIDKGLLAHTLRGTGSPPQKKIVKT